MLLLLLLAAAGPAGADPCDQLPKPSVTVQRIEVPISYNTEYSFRALNTIAAELSRPGRHVLGLTRGNAMVSFSSKSPSIIDARGRWECASPQITLRYGFNPMTVYVAREFPRGTCAYREIHDHEMRHVETYLQHIITIEKEVTEALNARFAADKIWRMPVGQAGRLIQQEFDTRWAPYVQQQIRRADEAQAKIDTAAEYERVTNACNGEIKKVLGGKSRGRP